jgi:hypothetical protein
MDVGELADQGTKYFDALSSILTKQKRSTEHIEVVFVLGDKPRTPQRGRLTEDVATRDRFNAFNGRYVLYDELIGNAQRQYQDYLEASDTAKTLNDLLDSLNPAALGPSGASGAGAAVRPDGKSLWGQAGVSWRVTFWPRRSSWATRRLIWRVGSRRW